MKNRNYEKRSRAYNGRLIRFFLAAILPIALLTTSCCATKQATQNHREIRDSVVIREVREVVPVKIPESTVEMEIPIENLHNLPEGSSYSEKSGQARVEVKYVAIPGEPEIIVVTATCDSLQVLCENLRRDLIRIREDTEKEKTEIRSDNLKTGIRLGAIIATVWWLLMAIGWSAIKRKFNIKNILK